MKRDAGKLLLGFIGLTAATVACHPGKSGNTPVVSSGRPECPEKGLALPAVRVRDRQVVNYTLTVIPVSGPITDVPEYHDCQRFIANNKYGPLVAIFAHHALDSLWSISDSNTGMASEAAAEIYSYDGSYDPLRIRTGFNCLYLFKQGSEWHAAMSWADRDADACLRSPQNAHPLTVRTQTWPHFQPTDYPPVARWDWDQRHGTQYIQIRCGSQWCEVGPADFQSSGSLATMPLPPVTPVTGVPPATPAEMRRVVTIKGWYDTQYLAIAGGSGLQPSTIMGTAIPSPSLEHLTSTSHFLHTWTESAYILIPDVPLNYSDKLGLNRGLNGISMCTGDFKDCPHASDVAEPACGADADHLWWGRVTGQTGDQPKYFCVTRRTHPGVEIPGAVRWRWDPDDEKIWIRCPNGCCTVS